MVTPAPSPGQVVGGRYRLEHVLNAVAGPQGDLWLARDTLAAEAPAAEVLYGAIRALGA